MGDDVCRAAVLDLEPGQKLFASSNRVDDICDAFAGVVDVKSSFTGSHSRVESFEEIAVVAGQHHEKLDGSGYPDGLQSDALSLDARIIAVADVYAALAEDRPYRVGLSLPQIRTIMDRETETKLDRTCFNALIAGLESGAEPASSAWLHPSLTGLMPSACNVGA